MQDVTPFATHVDFQTGVLEPSAAVVRRTLKDVGGIFSDAEAVDRIMSQEGDRLIYEVHVVAVPEEAGHLPYCSTVIHPGRVGDEFHMTKGHFHERRQRAEVYLGIAGQGILLLQSEDGRVEMIEMRPGTAAYVPPGWAHRTANTGEAPFTFFAVYPGDAGHDYRTIELAGFARILVLRNGHPVLIERPQRA
jgi:glucose-6-phosphate isomerase